MAVRNASQLLGDFCAAGVAVEVTHRSKRRPFGLTDLATLRDVVRPPYRPEPGCGRSRAGIYVGMGPRRIDPPTTHDRKLCRASRAGTLQAGHWRPATRALRPTCDGGPDRPLRPNCRVIAHSGMRALAAEGG